MEEFCQHMDISSQQEITFKKATRISSTDFSVESLPLSNLPAYMLSRIMTLDSNSRQYPKKKILPQAKEVRTETNTGNTRKIMSLLKKSNHDETNVVHPMDIVIYLYIQCHPIFRQTFVTQLAKCQLSIPLMTAFPSVQHPTFNLFSLKTLYKDFLDENNESKSFSVVEEKLPIISFVRFGDYVGSQKSQILNLILQVPNYFFHKDQIGSVKRRFLFDGTVEIAWILPTAKSYINTKDPCVILNLRGNALNLPKQLQFLSDISALIYLFIPINLCDHNMSQKLSEFHNDFGFKSVYLLYEGNSNHLESEANIDSFLSKVDEGKIVILPKANLGEESLSIAHDIEARIINVQNLKMSLVDCSFVAKKNKISVDTMRGNLEFCQSVSDSIIQQLFAKKPTQSTINSSDGSSSTKSLVEIKKMVLPLQMDGWSEWAKAKRALYKFELQGSDDFNSSKNSMRNLMEEARKKQLEALGTPSNFLTKVLTHCRSFGTFSSEDFYIIWTLLQNEFNKLSNQHLPPLYKEYRRCYELSCSYISTDEKGKESLKEHKHSLVSAANKIAECSFGIEHVFRELGQIFEVYANLSGETAKEQLDQNLKLPIACLSEIAAKLLFEGFSFEIVDGDANHVPLVWVKNVLKKLSYTIGVEKRIFVLSILGTQSSGKSTLLNTMFGANFAVSSGRCTRGMFMQLFPIEESLSAELGYDYLVLLDTEGLRAPEFSLSSYRRDNEMATFAVGLGDVTIINMTGECHSEVQDILQIIVFAFIRMRQSATKPRCIFVHQNVPDTQARTNLTLARGNLIKTLNKITVSAAEEENLKQIYTQFAEVIEFNPENDVFYFPGLLEGEPPLSQVAPGYTKMALKLRHYILNCNKNSGTAKRFQTVEEWSSKLKTLWKSVLRENFVFSYKNALEVKLRRELDYDLSSWYSRYIDAISNVKSESLNALFNADPEELGEAYDKIKLRISMERIDPKFEVDSQQSLMKEYFVGHENLEIISNWKANTEMFFKGVREKMISKVESEYEKIYKVQLTKRDMDIRFSKARREMVRIVRTLFRDLRSRGMSLRDKSIIEKEFQKLRDNLKENMELEEFPVGDISQDLQRALTLSSIISSMCVLPTKSVLVEDKTKYLQIGTQEFELLPGMNSPKHSNPHYYSFHDFSKKSRLRVFFSSILRYFVAKDSKGAKDPGLNQFKNMFEALKKECGRYLQEYSSALIRDQCPYDPNSFFVVIERCYKILEDHNNDETKNCHQSLELSTDFFFDFIFYQCCTAIPLFQEVQNKFVVRTSLDSKLGYLESQLKSSFVSHCDGIQSEYLCAVDLARITFNGMKDCLRDSVPRIFLSLFQNDPEHATIYKHRDALILRILKDLARQKEFDEYISYITNPFNYIIMYVQNCLSEYINRDEVIESCVQILLKSKVRPLIQIYKHAAYNASPDANVVHLEQNLPSHWDNFKKRYFSKIRTSVRNVTFSDLDVLDIHSISNYEQFCEFFSQVLEKYTTNWFIWFKSVLENERTLHKSITDNLLQCKALCPFCKEPCQLALGVHEHYCGTFHRPKGVNGWHHITTNKISAKECTTSIQNRGHFYYHDVRYEYINYKTVNDKFNSWKILAEDAMDSKYWQWVLYQFQDKFIEYYNIVENEAVSLWSDLTEEEVIRDLEAHYQSSIFNKN